MRLVPERTAWTRLPCRATKEPHPSPRPTLSYVEFCECLPKAQLCTAGMGGNTMKKLLGNYSRTRNTL
jgi:hypothetical protein